MRPEAEDTALQGMKGGRSCRDGLCRVAELRGQTVKAACICGHMATHARAREQISNAVGHHLGIPLHLLVIKSEVITAMTTVLITRRCSVTPCWCAMTSWTSAANPKNRYFSHTLTHTCQLAWSSHCSFDDTEVQHDAKLVFYSNEGISVHDAVGHQLGFTLHLLVIEGEAITAASSTTSGIVDKSSKISRIVYHDSILIAYLHSLLASP